MKEDEMSFRCYAQVYFLNEAESQLLHNSCFLRQTMKKLKTLLSVLIKFKSSVNFFKLQYFVTIIFLRTKRIKEKTSTQRPFISF